VFKQYYRWFIPLVTFVTMYPDELVIPKYMSHT